MSDFQQPGYWQASDGKWYPPSGSPPPAMSSYGGGGQSNPAGLLMLAGWLITLLGIAGGIMVIVEFTGDEYEFADLDFVDYMIQLMPSFATLGAGIAILGVAQLAARR